MSEQIKNIRATIDIVMNDNYISDWANENTDTYRDGVYGVDDIGVYHMYHHVRSELCKFADVEVLN